MIALRFAVALLSFAALALQQDVEELRRLAGSAPNAERYPNAEALILRHETRIQIAADGSVRTRLHRIVKGFDNRGSRRLASLRVPFSLSDSSVKLVKSRSLAASGTLIELEESAYDIEPVAPAVANDYADILNAVLVSPRGEVGDVSEILASHDRKRADPRRLSGWIDFRGHDPVAEQTLAIRLPAGIEMAYAFSSDLGRPNVRKVGSTTVYNWLATNRPTLVREEWSADKGIIGSRVLFSTYPSWAAVHRHLAGNLYADLSLPDEASDVADSLVEGNPDLGQIASRLDAFIRASIARIDIPADLIGYRTRPAARIFESGYAYSYDLAVLATALLKEAGVDSELALVSASESFVNSVPAPAQFDRIAVVMRAGSEGVWCYVDAPLADSRGLPPAGRTVMWLKPESYRLERIGETAAKKNSTQTRTELELTADGILRGNTYYSCSGSSTPYFSIAGGDKSLADFAAQLMSESGLSVEVENALLLRHTPTVCRYELRWSMPGLFSPEDGFGILHLPYPESADPGFAVPIWRDSRRTALVLPSAWEQQDQIDLRFPEGVEPYLMPQLTTVINPIGRCEISSKYDPIEKRLTIDRYLRIDRRIVQPGAYKPLRDILSLWRSPSTRTVVVAFHQSSK